MNRIFAIAAIIFVSSCTDVQLSEEQLFWVSIGEVAPQKLTKGYSTDGPFLLITIPTKNTELSEVFPDFNIFLFPDSKIVAGLRSDRTYKEETQCESDKHKISSILKIVYPHEYLGTIPKEPANKSAA